MLKCFKIVIYDVMLSPRDNTSSRFHVGVICSKVGLVLG